MSSSSLASGTSDGTMGSCSISAFPSIPTVYKDTSFDKCPRCKVQFDFLKRVNVSKVPLILTCKHTVCEDCIRRLVLTNTTVCPVCKVKFEVLRTQVDTLPELFPPHYTLIGHLVWSKNSPNRRNINLVSTGFTLGNRNSGSSELQEWTFDPDAKGDEASDDGYDKTTLSFVFDKCTEHTDQYVNIHCEECNNTYCCYCFLEYHVGHKPTYLYKLNATELVELEKLKSDIEVILGQLLTSKKQAKDLKTNDLANVDLDVKSYFIYLHAKLHVAERNIRKRLLNVELEAADLDGVTYNLKSAIYRVNQILSHFNLLNTKQLNVRALYEEAKEIRDIPCRLVSDQDGLRPIEFLTDNVFDDVEDNICLRTLSSVEYNLLPIEDWSQAVEKYELEQMKRQTELRNKSEPRTEIIKYVKRAENEAKKSTEAGKIRAIVTHINSLNSFFIQKYSALDCLKEMNANIGKRAKKRSGAEEYKIGGIYGVSYETKNSSHWRRGKLMEILRNAENAVQYKMYFLDYGNSQLVTKDKLKMLDIRTITRPSFSFECKLTNPDKIDLEPNAHLYLPQIIGEKELYVRFMEKQANRNVVQEVDLLLTTSNGGFISVRDLLVKSSVSLHVPAEKESVLTQQLRFFKNSKQFSSGSEERVVVTYVRDPYYICVQLAQNKKLMQKMKTDLEEYYKDKPVISCIPVADTDVIVKYDDEKQGLWHRAKIRSVDVANKEVGVYFVDWGYSTVVSWSSLRLLTENFIKAECQGIIVKLAAIEKLDMTKQWSEEVTNFLRGFLRNDECRMLVSDAEQLEVVLFQSRSAADICLNALLVEEKHVISTGSLSQTVYWPNLPADSDTEDDDDFSFQMVKKSGEVIIEEEEDAHLKSGLKLQVSVINFQSPDLIYIKFNKYKEIEEEMHKELQIHYSSSKSKTKNSWKVGDNCVVFDSVRNNYFRAEIKSAADGDNYVVYLYDHVRELKVSRKYIFVLNGYFERQMCYVTKCRLSNIKPAGDAGKWSSLAVEMLQKIFFTYKTIYVKKLEMNLHDKMLGVIMWYCLTTPAKALEPSKIKYISINRTLIESGVAFASSPISNGISTNNKAVKEAKSPVKGEDWYAMICEQEAKYKEREDSSEVSSEAEELHETGQNSWPEPFKIDFPEFDAILTCVDSEGHFSVRSLEMDKYYQELEENITSKLNSMDVTTEKIKWQANDMCTIFDDGKWYRGTVLEVLNDKEISVEMIDFGSEHVVSSKELTKLIMFLDIPPLINKVKLYDVYSQNGQWSSEDVSAILSLAPDNVRVVIKKDLTADVPYAELYLENGLSLNDLIVQKCPHMRRYENKITLGNLEDIERNCEDNENLDASTESGKSYNYICLSSPSSKKNKLFVVSVLKLDTLYNVVLSKKDSSNLDDPIGSDTEIQTQAAKQPDLQNIELNEPCICMHLQKKVWARALIYKVDSLRYGFVSTFFVDYGTVEMVPVKSLKKIRSEWLDLPVNMQIASIDIELVQNNQAEFVLMQLNSLRGKSVSVEIMSEEPLKVHLYDGENLFYKDLIDCGIVKAL